MPPVDFPPSQVRFRRMNHKYALRCYAVSDRRGSGGSSPMGRKIHSKQSIIQTLQNLAKSLGKATLTKQEVQTVVPVSSVNNHFGSLGNALEAAGLQRRSATEHLDESRRVLTDDGLFGSMMEVEQRLGHPPGRNEYLSSGKYSGKPFHKRFGKWPDILAYYRKWKSDKGVGTADTTAAAANRDQPAEEGLAEKRRHLTSMKVVRSGSTPAQLYGEPIDFRGLRHAPINEQGVVYLFGMVSRELGFYVESIQQGFPDCEGKYLHDPSRNLWAKARIEFEFKASNFREHGHDPQQCDFIVCWIDDWQESPITVIELRREIGKLPQR